MRVVLVIDVLQEQRRHIDLLFSNSLGYDSQCLEQFFMTHEEIDVLIMRNRREEVLYIGDMIPENRTLVVNLFQQQVVDILGISAPLIADGLVSDLDHTISELIVDFKTAIEILADRTGGRVVRERFGVIDLFVQRSLDTRLTDMDQSQIVQIEWCEIGNQDAVRSIIHVRDDMDFVNDFVRRCGTRRIKRIRDHCCVCHEDLLQSFDRKQEGEMPFCRLMPQSFHKIDTPKMKGPDVYNYVRSLVLKRKVGAIWEQANLLTQIVANIFSTYEKVYLVLTVDGDEKEVIVDLEQLKAEYALYNNTLEVMLGVIANRPLDTSTSLPIAQSKVAYYRDALQAGYKLNRTKIGMANTTNYPVSEMNDLAMIRKGGGTDMRLHHRFCLHSVNGFFHKSDADEEKLYIVDGAKCMDKCNVVTSGFISFFDIGELTKENIKPSNISVFTGGEKLKDMTKLTVETDMTNKSFFLVLGGYLVFPQKNVMWSTGGQDILIDFKRLPLLERYFESDIYLDQSYLGLTPSSTNDSQISVEELYSDAVLQKLLTGPYSYVVVVDTPRLYLQKRYMRSSAVPGLFNAYQEPKFPLFVAHGRCAEYWKVFESDVWAVTINDPFLRNYLFRYSRPGDIENPDNAMAPQYPFSYGEGFMLEIGKLE